VQVQNEEGGEKKRGEKDIRNRGDDKRNGRAEYRKERE